MNARIGSVFAALAALAACDSGSHAGMTDTLIATGPIPIADGQARTVAVLDSTSGHVTWRLVPDRN